MTNALVNDQPRKPRVMFLDIEATNLSGNFGYVLCIAWQWEGEKKVYSLDITQSPGFETDPTNDKWLLRQFAKELLKADMLVFHYGARFDYPYLQTRALYHKMKPFVRVPWIDTWRICKYGLALNSNRLATVASLLRVEEKTPLNGPIWIRAMAGHRTSIRYVVRHCKQDVVVLRQVYERIRPLRPLTGPKMAVNGACPACGSPKVQKNGLRITVKQKKMRMKCNNCGHWFEKPIPRD